MNKNDILKEIAELKKEVSKNIPTNAIKFYADSMNYKNKLFSFKVKNEKRALIVLFYFRINLNRIRSAYYHIWTHGGQSFQMPESSIQRINNLDYTLFDEIN